LFLAFGFEGSEGLKEFVDFGGELLFILVLGGDNFFDFFLKVLGFSISLALSLLKTFHKIFLFAGTRFIPFPVIIIPNRKRLPNGLDQFNNILRPTIINVTSLGQYFLILPDRGLID
jgi:hypothetical protein